MTVDLFQASCKLNESRRPGFTALAERVRTKNPTITVSEVLARTKVLYTSPRVHDSVSGWIDNPDYLGKRTR